MNVTGVVQGVGFRPFVHRLAARHGLCGWVRNASGAVQIEIEGGADRVEAFVAALTAEAPPLARIQRIETIPHRPDGLRSFAVVDSVEDLESRLPISPDAAICAACERELRDPADRRYGYPFITCTDCGPRFTVIHGLPYDRERTSMAGFQQCPACQAEYEEPGNRRFHSETNSCETCGPRVWFVSSERARVDGNAAALDRAAALLRGGGILAVRGLGGFHLAVDATNDAAVRRLRERKRRDAKPLAVMVDSLAAARTIARVSDSEAALLASVERPIVLLATSPAAVAPSVAPGLAWVGVMLPSTPLHHLLLDRMARPLVMTSGNLSEEPIATGNDEALSRLGTIADGFLLHDREIVARYDDSVLRLVGERPLVLRRARGYAPMPLSLPIPASRPLLAVGPHLKNTLTLAEGGTAFVSQHVGDLENLETLEHFEATLNAYRRLFRIEPEVVVRDLHPGYLSTLLAEKTGLEPVAVQHHHAHVAAVLAEHGLTGPAIGVAYDGTGWGPDGTVWGAEILIAGLWDYVRVGHFRPAPLPGGDLAARTPWRSALGFRALDPSLGFLFEPALAGVPERERIVAEQQLARGLNSPLASSMGRLFDAAAALLGIRRVGSYEGQAAMELESAAGRRPAAEHAASIEEREGVFVADPLPILEALAWQLQRGADPADLAADFHASVAWTTEELVRRAVDASGVETVVLSGGSFQNVRLLDSLQRRLAALGLRVLVPRALSPNDGAISYGQAAVAAARLAA